VSRDWQREQLLLCEIALLSVWAVCEIYNVHERHFWLRFGSDLAVRFIDG